MKKLVTRLAMVAALAAYAVPALACDGMKNTQASTQEKVEKKDATAKKAETQKPPPKVASADKK